MRGFFKQQKIVKDDIDLLSLRQLSPVAEEKSSARVLDRTLSAGSYLQRRSFALFTSQGMGTFLHWPNEGTIERKAAGTFIESMQRLDEGDLQSSLLHLQALKHNIDLNQVEAFLQSQCQPEKLVGLVSPKTVEKLDSIKDLGFLFVELLQNGSPLVFGNNKKFFCLISLSQESVMTEEDYSKQSSEIRDRIHRHRDCLEKIKALLFRQMALVNKNERDQEQIRNLKAARVETEQFLVKLEKKLKKITLRHETYLLMRPHIQKINDHIRKIARQLNEDESHPVHFIPTLKSRNRFLNEQLARLDQQRVPCFQEHAPAAREMISDYMEIKSLEEEDRQQAAEMLEQLMQTETPVLTKACSEKMLANTFLKLVRQSVQLANQPVSLNFRAELHYPLSWSSHNKKIVPEPHENCRTCKFTWFLVYSALNNQSQFGEKLGLSECLDCLSDDDDPEREIQSIAIEPYHRACDQHKALLLNIQDLAYSHMAASPLGVPDTFVHCLMVLHSMLSSLNRKRIRPFAALMEKLANQIAKIEPLQETETKSMLLDECLREVTRFAEDSMSLDERSGSFFFSSDRQSASPARGITTPRIQPW